MGAFALARNFAFGEYISPSPLVSKLPDALRADMRTGFCCARRARRARFDERVAPPTNEKSNPVGLLRSLEAPPGIEPGIEVLQTFALPLGHGTVLYSLSKNYGHENLSFSCPFLWSGLRGSNPPPRPWQGRALPNELNPRMVPRVGIEPTTL